MFKRFDALTKQPADCRNGSFLVDGRYWSDQQKLVAVRNCDMIYVQLGYKPRLLLISTDLAKDPSTSLPGCTRLDDRMISTLVEKPHFCQCDNYMGFQVRIASRWHHCGSIHGVGPKVSFDSLRTLLVHQQIRSSLGIQPCSIRIHQNPWNNLNAHGFFPCFPTFSHVFFSKNLKIHHCYHPTVATVAVVAGHPGGLLRLLRAAPPRAARHLGHLQPLRGPRHRGDHTTVVPPP